MSGTLIVGDIHGCAGEFEDLLERAAIGRGDRVVCVGDLFSRGPRPDKVLRLFQAHSNLEFVLGNHDLPLLRYLKSGSGKGKRRALNRTQRKCLERMRRGREELQDVLKRGRAWIRGRIRNRKRRWLVVHGGVHPHKKPEETALEDLVALRQLPEWPGQPFWWDVYAGPWLVLFGHTPRRRVIERFRGARRVALGLDTGCVYGGALTAYWLERDRFCQVRARKAYCG